MVYQSTTDVSVVRWDPTQVSTVLFYWSFLLECSVAGFPITTCFASHYLKYFLNGERQCTQNEWSKETNDMRLKGLDKTILTSRDFFLWTCEPTNEFLQHIPIQHKLIENHVKSHTRK